jgi:hypothetical protein
VTSHLWRAVKGQGRGHPHGHPSGGCGGPVVDAVVSSVRIQSVYSICAVVRRIVFMLRGCLCPFDIKLGSHRQKLQSWSNTLGYCRSRRIILYLFKEL